MIEPDRDKAIRLRVEEARAGDIVLLAGKGHEDYQIFADRTIHFDDREVAGAALTNGVHGSAQRTRRVWHVALTLV